MAVVGSAEIVVRAITTGFKDDVKKGLQGIDSVGDRAGNDLGTSFSRGFAKGFGQNAANILDIGPVLANSQAAVASFASLQRQSFVVASAITALGGVIGSLVGGIGILINTVLAASPVLLGLVNIFGAVAVSAAILRTVFKGVGEAISNGNKGIDASADAQERLNDATDALNDATYAYNELIKDQATNLKALEVARDRAAEAVADAALSSERAERSYQDSVKATEKAIEDVTKAREDAKEAIQQLRFELEGGVISEKKARLEFEKARESLQRVQDLPPNSRARREAELAFAEADLNLRRAIDKNGDLRKETAKANKEGINGNKNVLAAEAKVVDSKLKQQDAEIAAFKAVRELTRAQEGLLKAENDLLPTSERARKEARARELASRAVREATEDEEKARKALNTALGEAAVNLSPSAQEFVDYIVSLKERLEELRLKLQENFFEKFTPAVKLLVETYLPIMEELLPKIATSLGIVAEKFAKVFTDPEIVEAVRTIFEEMSPLIEAIGGAFANLAGSATLLLAAFAPFATEWAQHVEKLTEGWLETLKNKEATGELEAVMKTAAEVMNSLWRSLGNFIGGVGNTIKAQFSEGGGGWFFLDWLEQVTEKWEQFTKRGDADGSLDAYILGLSVNFTKLLTTIGLVVKGMLDIAASEGFGMFMDDINASIGIFNDIGLDIANNALPAVGDFILAMSELIKLFFDAETIAIFFKVLTVPIQALVAIFDNELGRAVLAGIGVLAGLSLALGLLKIVIMQGLIPIVLGLIGNFLTLFTFVMPAGSAASLTLTKAMGALAAGNIAAAAPLLIVIAAVVALIAIFKLAYDNSEIVREAFKALGEALKNILGNALEDIKESFKRLVGEGDGLKNFLVGFGEVLTGVIVPAIAFVVGALVGFATGTINRVIFALSAVKEVFMFVFNFFKTLVGVVVGAITGDWTMMFKGLEGGLKAFQQIFANIMRALLAPFRGLINGMIDAWNGLAGKFKIKIPKWVPGFGGSEFQLPTIPRIPNLAMGGVVYPTTGGTLARVAEAGSAERIEPLDPSGLSKRDRAMIELLAGPAGGINITVNPSPGMDERELAALVSRQLAFQLRKGAA